MAFIAGVMPAGAHKKVSINVSTELMGDENKTISVAKDSKGYMTLFDGKTFTGWRGYGKGHVPARWTIENGCLKFNAGQGEGGDIIFAHKFKNFVLEMDWVNACKESPKYRHKCNSDFSEAGPFNEMVVMGVLAVRLQGLNKVLEWDGENMRFTNIGENETIKTCIKDGFTIHNGHPSFNKTWTEPQNAIKLSQEMIKHTYRDGWKLPDMPK